jgi:hypothetical protein
MKTVNQNSEKNVLELYDENEAPRKGTETSIQKEDLRSQKNFRVVDLWKIRSMKKYFNYQ